MGLEGIGGQDVQLAALRVVRGKGCEYCGLEEYRRHAAECFRIAKTLTDPQHRMLLLGMAQAWLQLAYQATKNLATGLVYETPPPPITGGPVVTPQQQQQQQIQPKNEE
jgi:hypothetical protein